MKQTKQLNRKAATHISRYLSVRSRHPSVRGLRHSIILPKTAVYRHGSISPINNIFYEINSIQSVKNSSSKLLMKKCFDEGKVRHLPWILLSKTTATEKLVTDGKTELKFPIVVKQFFGSRGQGNYKINTREEFNQFLKGKTLSNYLIEPFYNGSMEFRIHITKLGPIYCLRKLLKSNIPKDQRWIRNDTTCVWITEFTQRRDSKDRFLSFNIEPHPDFDKPGNWNEILEECKKALISIGGDVLAVDVKTQSNYDSKNNRRNKVDFYILEVNSAPAMGEITTIIYKKELPIVLKNKYDNFR